MLLPFRCPGPITTLSRPDKPTRYPPKPFMWIFAILLKGSRNFAFLDRVDRV